MPKGYLGRSTDGWLLRHLIRPLSAPMSRLLAKTSVRPNQVSYFILFLSVVAACLVAQKAYVYIALGGIFFHLTSVLDCVDGELARLKNAGTPFGAKLDTVVDRIGIFLFLIGAIVGLSRQGFSQTLVNLSLLAAMGLFLSTFLGYLVSYLWRNRAPTDTVERYQNFSHYLRTHKVFSFFPFGRFLILVSRREFISLLFMVTALANRLDALIWLIAIGANLAWILLVPMTWNLTRGEYETV